MGEILDRLASYASADDMAPLRPVAVLAALDADEPDLARDLMARWDTEIKDDGTAESERFLRGPRQGAEPVSGPRRGGGPGGRGRG
ncbi:hypothetical protein [Nonomuraea sp. NPDC050786]|uniref:hypothetical protein n=1 Tax=Nonomuraea sp. NPDC050786 TaxID=3154840 RepID=UPI0033F41DD0